MGLWRFPYDTAQGKVQFLVGSSGPLGPPVSQIQPGWYADPSAGPAWLRWWDGSRWTAHVAPPPAHTPPATGPTTPDGVPLAGWWWRVLAYIVDGFVVAIPNAILTLPAQLGMQRQMQELMRELDAGSADGQVARLQRVLP